MSWCHTCDSSPQEVGKIDGRLAKSHSLPLGEFGASLGCTVLKQQQQTALRWKWRHKPKPNDTPLLSRRAKSADSLGLRIMRPHDKRKERDKYTGMNVEESDIHFPFNWNQTFGKRRGTCSASDAMIFKLRRGQVIWCLPLDMDAKDWRLLGSLWSKG